MGLLAFKYSASCCNHQWNVKMEYFEQGDDVENPTVISKLPRSRIDTRLQSAEIALLLSN